MITRRNEKEAAMVRRIFNFSAPMHQRKRKIVLLAVLSFIAMC